TTQVVISEIGKKIEKYRERNGAAGTPTQKPKS
ncbi:unnamed protein product, partial [marine sediment metagenome]